MLRKENKNFYPTPKNMGEMMANKIVGYPNLIIDPQAGKGDLIEVVKDRLYNRGRCEIVAIEKDEVLQATLRGKGVNVIDSDWLTFSGPDKFDLIIMNPPFDNGDQHLLKAINVLYSGQIICLLNAETLRNPYSNTRKLLVRLLGEMGAEVEYISGAFKDAERKTDVDVALVNIVIERDAESDLFIDAKDEAKDCQAEFQEKHEVSTGKTIAEMVLEYNEIVRLATETIMAYYRNYRKVGKYIGLNEEAGKYGHSADKLTQYLQGQVNTTVRAIRKDFWMKALDLPEVLSRLTTAKKSEFQKQLNDRSHMDFTESNIRSFILNIIDGYEDTIMSSVLGVFDRFTKHGYRSDTTYEKNIHYFNGWKTNDAFKVGKRVVIPVYASYGNPFTDWGKWRLDYRAAESLRDIELVMNYFSGKIDIPTISSMIDQAFASGKSSGIDTEYFKVTCYKKGTVHLTFKDDDILRRFNVAACKGKGWLPDNYGSEEYGAMSTEVKNIVNSFEGEKEYSKNVNVPLFAPVKNQLKLAA
jgi:methylase of polypeptide subunit release factors